MNRLETSQRRLQSALARLEESMSLAGKAKADLHMAAEELSHIEERAEHALKLVRDIARQQEEH